MADPLSIAGSVAGLVSIADAVFTRTYRYVRQVKNAETEIGELASGIRSLSGTLHGLALVLSELERETNETNFRLHHINSCRATLTAIETKLDCYDVTTSEKKLDRVIKRLRWPFSHTETKELIADVERHKSTINVALSADGLRMTLKALSRQDEISSSVQEIEIAIKTKWAMDTHIALSKERSAVLTFFEKVDTRSNHESSLNLLHPLTGLWVTEGEVFQSWLHKSNSKLWLSGIPGAGKTIIAASLIEETMRRSSPKRGVAYFYCDYKDPEKQDPINVLGSLAAQLSRQNDSAFSFLQTLYNTCHPKDHSPLRPKLLDLTRMISDMANSFDHVSILVDGVDECGNNVWAVTESIASLALDNNTSILILSRDVSDVRDCLREQYSHLDIAARSEDLKIYVAAEIETRSRARGRGQLRIRSTDLKEHIMKTLIDKADGMFRWVACQLDYLCEFPTDREKRSALQSLPPSLNETYERILAGVIDRGPAIQRMVQTSLRWLVHSEDLSIRALCEAVSITVGETSLDQESMCDPEDILRHCGCLVRKGVDLDYLELAHFTVREFLEGIQLYSPYSQFSQKEEDVLPQLAIICLTYLNLNAFQDEVIDNLEEWEAQQLKHPLRAHAVEFWADYAMDCWANDEILTLARKLFDLARTKGFLSWFRDHLYICSISTRDEPKTREFVFSELTGIVCSRGVTPLHAAAAQGSVEMCLWLLQYDCDINEMSGLGTPIHCALTGIFCLSDVASYQNWLHVPHEYMRQRRTAVLKLLIENGASLDVPYTDPLGQEFSCSKLALHANMTHGASHPLVTLVAAGARLDEGLLASFERSVESSEYDYDLQQDYQEFLQALNEALKNSIQAESTKTDILTAILRFKNPIVAELAHEGAEGYSKVSLTKLRDIFYRAVKFDQVEMIDDLLRDPRLHLSTKFGHDQKTALHIAVSNECVNATEKLLLLGAEVDALSAEGRTPLHYSVEQKCQNVGCIRLLLKFGASTVLKSKDDGRTVWHVAADFGDKAALELLGGEDENMLEALAIADDDGFVPLVLAAQKETSKAFEVILSLTDRLPEECPDGLKLVHYVVEMNSVDLLEKIKQKGCDITDQTDDGRAALHFIPVEVDGDVVKFLIENGVSPHSADEDGVTALHRVFRDEITTDRQVLKFLATQETISARTSGGHSVLHYALGFSPIVGDEHTTIDYSLRKDYVEFLVHEGFDVSAKDSQGKSAIQFLKYHPFDQVLDESVSAILATIAESTSSLGVLNDVFDWGNDAQGGSLCWAIGARNEGLAALLISKGANVDLHCQVNANYANWSAIHAASWRGVGLDLFRRIIKKTKRIHERDNRGYCVIHILCESGSQAKPAHVQEVLDAGADIDIQVTYGGSTALMISAEAGKADMVRCLLDNGADIQVKGSFGWQAIHFAVSSGDPTTIRIFLELHTDWNTAITIAYGRLNIPGCNIIHLAAIDAYHDNNAMKEILESSPMIDLNCLTGDGYSALHLAAMHGTGDTVQALLNAGANIELESSRGIRPINSAIEKGRHSTTETLLQWGCEMKADKFGFTPELYALKRNDGVIVRMLKKHQLTPGMQITVDNQMTALRRRLSKLENIPEENHRSSRESSMMLHYAIKDGDLDLCKTLIGTGASINDPVLGCRGCTPVLWSMTCRQIPIARYLIEKGASAAGQSCSKANEYGYHYKGHYAVHLACRAESDVDLLSLLLEQDVKLGSPAFQAAVTPLHIAVLCNNTAAVELILAGSKVVSSSPTIMSTEGDTPLPPMRDSAAFATLNNTASLCDKQIEGSMLDWEWLLCHDAKTSRAITTSEIDTGSALHLAVYVDHGKEMVDLLLKHGANIDLLDDDGDSPLHVAIERGNLVALNLLLHRGANPILTDRCGRTPAMLAVNSMVALERLHAAGVPLDHVDHSGNNALHWARSPAIFSFLFYKGVDPYAQNHEGNTPVAIAYSEPEFPELICNLDVDFSRCAGFIFGADFLKVPSTNLKLLMRRLPQHTMSEEINSSTGRFRGTPLTRVSRVGGDCIHDLDILLKYGASLDKELDDAGTPLMAACKSGRLDSVKRLVLFSGGKLTGTIAGRPINAIEAASDFPHIQRWLLVGRHMEQRKISWTAVEESTEQYIRPWSGHLLAEVAVAAISAPSHSTDSMSLAIRLEKLRISVRGKIVPVTALRYEDATDS
ncbi:hypothetical protein VTL71DRAFT_2491 [Oculimacula yallundae]|uniref:Ankyrin n=1 Tax=Oculimacula yallundae TaxID=86028 RepID=A0ABR4C907_9HELO